MKNSLWKKVVLVLLCLCMAGMFVACADKKITETGNGTDVTEAPMVTTEVTEIPEITKEPEATSTPAPTKTPTPTKAPVVVSEVEGMKVVSPDGNTCVQFWSDTEGVWYYSVDDEEQPIIGKSRIGMELKEGSLYKGLSLAE